MGTQALSARLVPTRMGLTLSAVLSAACASARPGPALPWPRACMSIHGRSDASAVETGGRFTLHLRATDGFHQGQARTALLVLVSEGPGSNLVHGTSDIGRQPLPGVFLAVDPAIGTPPEYGVNQVGAADSLFQLIIGSAGDEVGIRLRATEWSADGFVGSWSLGWFDSATQEDRYSSGQFCATRQPRSE